MSNLSLAPSRSPSLSLSLSLSLSPVSLSPVSLSRSLSLSLSLRSLSLSHSHSFSLSHSPGHNGGARETSDQTDGVRASKRGQNEPGVKLQQATLCPLPCLSHHLPPCPPLPLLSLFHTNRDRLAKDYPDRLQLTRLMDAFGTRSTQTRRSKPQKGFINIAEQQWLLSTVGQQLIRERRSGPSLSGLSGPSPRRPRAGARPGGHPGQSRHIPVAMSESLQPSLHIRGTVSMPGRPGVRERRVKQPIPAHGSGRRIRVAESESRSEVAAGVRCRPYYYL
jgi:hypothetical protein